MRNNFLFASLAMLIGSSVGCVGGLTDPNPTTTNPDPGPTSTARDLFNTTVSPLVGAECASCHVGPETSATNMYLGQSMTSDSYYNGIVNDRAVNGGFVPATASLLTQGAHQGPAWTPAQATTIAAWLTAEATARGTVTPPSATNPTPTPTPAQANLTALGAEMQWAACLSISATEYNTTVAYAIADMNSEDGRCYSCHEPGGAGGAYWGIDNKYMTMLSKWQEAVFITGPFEATEQNTTPVTYQMEVAQEKVCDKGQEQANNEGTHPSFDCNQNVDGVVPLTALASFTTMVQAKIAAGSCPTPAFLDPNAGSGSGSGSGSGTD